MSFFEDYVEDGLCCESCGGYLDGDEPGFIRRCAGCQRAESEAPKPKTKRGKRK